MIGLPILLVLALASAFFGWVSAEPLWLAVGHSQEGTATVTSCSGGRCVASFAKPDGSFANGIRLFGVARTEQRAGAMLPARMTSSRSHTAYAGHGFAARAGVGMAILLVCGLGIAWATGARRLASRRNRFAALAISVLAPFGLFAGLLAATW
jgi:hypothetical protein